jgi:hypothetical protein
MMNVEPTSESVVENMRWVVDELIDFMESCLVRNERDLKLHGLRTSDTLAKALTWMHNTDKAAGRVSLESIAARVAEPALNEILAQPNRRLRRTRQLVPMESLRAQDARCLMWLARRPGNNLNEKLTKDRRLLGVVRELSFDVLENRVAHETARLLSRLLSAESAAWNHAAALKTRSTTSDFIRMAESKGIRSLSHSPRPNNSLLRDRKYRRIWLAYRWLLARDEFRESVGNRVCRCMAEALTLMVAALPQSMGFEMADAAVPCMARPSAERIWVRDFSIRWIRFGTKSMDHLDVRLVENGGVPQVVFCLKHFKSISPERVDGDIKEIVLKPTIQDGKVTLTIHGAGDAVHVLLSEGAEDLRHLANILQERLPDWLQPVSGTIRPAPMSEAAGNRVLRFAADGIESGNRRVDCFCGSLEANTDEDSVTLIGAGARNRRILGLGGVWGSGWITPGRLSRSLSRSGGTGVAFRDLMALATRKEAGTTIRAIAVPAGLPFGFESAIDSAIRSNGNECWMIPQPVAAAIAAAWGDEPVLQPKPSEFICAIDLAGERVDASLLRWIDILGPSGSKSPGWLHFREIRDAERLGPRSINLVYKVLKKSLANAGIPRRKLRVACLQALHQVHFDQLSNLLADTQSSIDVWVFNDTDQPRCCVIRADDVRSETTEWLENSVFPWLKQRLDFWTAKQRKVHTLLLNGPIFIVPIIRDIVIRWAVNNVTEKPVFMERDHVSNGLHVFIKRHLADEVTWSEHLPVLEILGRNTENQPQWLRLFDEDASVRVGGKILMGEAFSFSADHRVFSVPMRCDKERGMQDPCIRLPDSSPIPLALNVQAHYDVGRAGLVMKVQSKEGGLLPEIVMEWGAAVAAPSGPQELQVYDDPLDASVIEILNQRLKNAMGAFFIQNANQNDMRSAIDGVARLLGGSLRSSESGAWRNVKPESVVELAGRLSWMHQSGLKDYHSPLLSARKWNCEYVSGFARTRKATCLDSILLQTSLTRALGKMKTAAPQGFIQWSAEHAKQGKEQAIRHESIRTLGRTFGPADSPTAQDVLKVYDRALLGPDALARHRPEDRSVWYWSFHAALSHSEASVARFGLERIKATLNEFFYDLGELAKTPDSIDPALLRNLLAAILAARHGTRLDGGMESLGPESGYSKNLVKRLENADLAISSTWDRRKLETVTILGFLDDTNGATAFRSTSPVGQVAEIWAGKVKTLLRQVIDSD